MSREVSGLTISQKEKETKYSCLVKQRKEYKVGRIGGFFTRIAFGNAFQLCLFSVISLPIIRSVMSRAFLQIFGVLLLILNFLFQKVLKIFTASVFRVQ